MGIFTSDLLIRRALLTFLVRLQWPYSVLAPGALIFLLAELLGEFRGFRSSPLHPWSDRRQFSCVRFLFLILLFVLPLFYWIAVEVMTEPVEGSPG